MSSLGYGHRQYQYWETGEYDKNGLRFDIYQGGFHPSYEYRKYIVVYRYGNYGLPTAEPTNDWRKVIRQVISTSSKLGNKGKYEGLY